MKQMKYFWLLLMLPFVLILGACSEDDDKPIVAPTLSVEPSGVVILKTIGESRTLTVTTNQAEWKASHPQIDNWCELSQDGDKLILTAKENLDTETLNTVVTISVGTGDNILKTLIKVQQPGVGKSALLLDPDNLTLEASAMDKTITAYTDETVFVYPTEKVDGWCKMELTDAANRIFTISADVNEELTERVAKLVVSVGKGKGEAKDTLTVTQKGVEKATLSSVLKAVTIESEGTGVAVDITTNQPEVRSKLVNTADSWCHWKMDNENKKLTISADPFEGPEDRRITKIALEVGRGKNIAYDTIQVIQTKPGKIYNLWDVYEVNGEKLGLVYKVTDGGKHGMIISLQEDKQLSLMYQNVPQAVGASDISDGRVNMAVVQALEGYPENFPLWKFAEELNTKDPAADWYIPAKEELRDLAEIYNGVRDADVNHAASGIQHDQEKRDLFNQKLTDAGGVKFETSKFEAYYPSSTESDLAQDKMHALWMPEQDKFTKAYLTSRLDRFKSVSSGRMNKIRAVKRF